MAAALRPGSPAVSGATQRSLRRVTTLHGLGLLAGAILMSLTLSLVRALVIVAGVRAVLIVPVVIALALAALQSAGLRIPDSSWQVPEYWRRVLDADLLPVAYGAILGFGVFTSVVVSAFWVFVAATLIYTVPLALIGWSAYALGRAIGFRLAVQTQPLERILLTPFHRRMIVIATTVTAALVVVA